MLIAYGIAPAPLMKAVAPHHRHRGGDPAPVQVRCEPGADAVQLVGVPAEFEDPVERLQVNESAEEATHSGPHLVNRQRVRPSGQYRDGGIGGRRRGPAETDDVALAGAQLPPPCQCGTGSLR